MHKNLSLKNLSTTQPSGIIAIEHRSVRRQASTGGKLTINHTGEDIYPRLYAN